MVMLALAVPLAGAAFATHGAEPVAVVDLEPEQDQAATGTCNAFIVTLTDDDVDPAEGETIDVLAEQVFAEDAVPANDPTLEFCEPTTGQEPSNPVPGGAVAAQGDECPTDANLANPNQDCATLHGEFVADAEGEVIFGIRSDTAGTMVVTAYAEAQNPACTPAENTNNLPDNCEPQDDVLKTWTAGGAAGVAVLDCEPEFASNNLDAGDTTHTFMCTATNAAGDPVGDVAVQFEVTAGPNADNSLIPGNQPVTGNCGTTTTGETGTAPAGTIGEVECSYDEGDDLEFDEVGTDTIVAFVDQDADNDPDAGEPQDEIQKAWTFGARNIDCTPKTATNDPGDENHLVTCTVTDREGNPVSGTTVTFTETGPGRFQNNQSTTTDVTDGTGQATATATAQQNEEGTQEITGTITDENQGTPGNQTTGECQEPADQPQAGDPAGNCAETVLKNWVEPGAPPPPAQCQDGIDNDGDGLIDHPDDPGCESPTDPTESPNPDPDPGGPTGGPCQGFGFNTRTNNAVGGQVIVGSPGNDVLIGTDGDDIICGLGGNDVITAGAGKDLVVGNQGDDIIDGGGGKDTLRGGADDDTIDGGNKNDVIIGGGGNDTLRGNSGWDTIRGGRGKDTLQGGRGNDILRGGRGHDTLRGFTGDDLLNGGAGTDTCRPGRGNDTVKNCERR
ncbi:MAG: hypothetical protein ACR2KQ_06690 [Actinomycetota bacterium]